MRAQTHLVLASILLALSIAGTQTPVRGQEVPYPESPHDRAPVVTTPNAQPPNQTFAPGPATPTFQPSVTETFQPPVVSPGCSTCTPPAEVFNAPPAGVFAAPTVVSPGPACGGCPTPTYCGPGLCPNPCAPTCEFIAGIDFTMFHASVHGIHDFAEIPNFGDTPNPTVGLTEDDLYRKFTYAPRIYGGVGYDGWAVLGRFWYLSDSTNSFTPLGPNATFSDDQLKAYTADIELDRAFVLWGSKIDLFVGARYASFSADQSVDVASSVFPFGAVADANSLSQFSFNGWGVTAGFQGHTPIAGTELNILWGFRASVLWGEAERRALATASLLDGAGASVDTAGSIETNHARAYILEPTLGLEWRHELRWLPMSTYLKVAFEYQYWNLGGNGSLTQTATATAPFTAPATATASIGDVTANLIGLNVGAGLNW
jgi:hypothetical protein